MTSSVDGVSRTFHTWRKLYKFCCFSHRQRWIYRYIAKYTPCDLEDFIRRNRLALDSGQFGLEIIIIIISDHRAI